MKRFTIWMIAISGAAFSSASVMAEDECFRHSECDGDELCINTTCTVPDEPLAPCDSSGSCAGYNEVCDESFCKKDGVYCENDAGRCHLGNGWIRCGCADGVGMDGGGEAQDPVPTDEELYEECNENLVLSCGEDAPDLHDECTDDQLATCESYYEKQAELAQACGEETEEPGFAEMASCCRHADDDDFAEKLECLMGLGSADCDKVGDCYPAGQDAGAGDMGGDSYEDRDDDVDGDSGEGGDGDPSLSDDSDFGEAGGDSEEGSGSVTASDDGGSSDGCSVVPAGRQTAPGFLALVALGLGLLAARVRIH